MGNFFETEAGDPYQGNEPRYKDATHFRYYGNYCGPGFSAGKFDATPEEILGGTPLDDLDDACKTHDLYYTLGKAEEGDAALHEEVKDRYTLLDQFNLNWNFGSKLKAGALGNLGRTNATVLLDQGFQGKGFYEKYLGTINKPKPNSNLTSETIEKIQAYIKAQQKPGDNSAAEQFNPKKYPTNPFAAENRIFPGTESINWVNSASERGFGPTQSTSSSDAIPGAQTANAKPSGKCKKEKSCGCGCGSAKMQGGNPTKTVDSQMGPSPIVTEQVRHINPIMAFNPSDLVKVY